MCRNIKPLFNFDARVTAEEVRAASPQFVRRISGFNKPSQTNEALFLAVVDDLAGVSARLIHSLETTALRKDSVLESVAQLSYPSRSEARNGRPASGW
jgi:hypothetical protein